MTRQNRPLTVAAVLLCMFMAAMEATVVATAMPTVVADLGGLELYGWVGASYMLACTVTIPLYGKLANLWGRRPVLLLGLAFFLAGSMASGAAGSMPQLIAFRGLQGLGAGALQPIALTIVADLFPIEQRARAQGIFGAVWGFSAIVGPLLGGLIVKVLSWRWVFYVNVPFGALSAVLLVTFFQETGKTREKMHLDVLGALLLSAAIVSVLLGASGVAPALTVPASLVLGAAFVRVQQRAPEPIFPMALLRTRSIAVASAAGGLLGAVMMGTLVFVPLFVQSVLGGTPTQAGTAVAPMLVGWPIAAVVSGKLLVRIGFRPLVRVGVVVTALASVYLALNLAPGQALGPVRVAMTMFGVGLGLTNTALLIAVQDSVTWEQRGVATASTMFTRSIGGAIALGTLGALLAHTLGDSVPPAVVNELLGPEHGRKLDPRVLASLSGGLMEGLSRIFRSVAALSIVAVVVSWMFPDQRVRVRALGEAT